jgi:hypothetical protein
MRREELVDAIHSSPFRPFRVYVSDGRTFDIRHPEMMMLMRHSAVIGIQEKAGTEEPGQGYPVIDGSTWVDLLHVTGIEQLSQPFTSQGA